MQVVWLHDSDSSALSHTEPGPQGTRSCKLRHGADEEKFPASRPCCWLPLRSLLLPQSLSSLPACLVSQTENILPPTQISASFGTHKTCMLCKSTIAPLQDQPCAGEAQQGFTAAGRFCFQSTAAGHVQVGSFGGLSDEVDSLRRDKNVLMMELVRLRQQQQVTVGFSLGLLSDPLSVLT